MIDDVPWGNPKALLHLSPDYCGLGITSVTDRTFIKKWATLQSALHSDGPHASAAEGHLYIAAASQGTYLIAIQEVVLFLLHGVGTAFGLVSLLVSTALLFLL